MSRAGADEAAGEGGASLTLAFLGGKVQGYDSHMSIELNQIVSSELIVGAPQHSKCLEQLRKCKYRAGCIVEASEGCGNEHSWGFYRSCWSKALIFRVTR